MIGGQPFWRDIDVARVPVPLLQLQDDNPRWVSPETAINLASALCNVPRADIVSERRQQEMVRARALVTWVLRTVPVRPMSYPKIGRALGGRDHTSIMHLHQVAIRRRLEDEAFRRSCEAICLHFGLSRRIPRGN